MDALKKAEAAKRQNERDVALVKEQRTTSPDHGKKTQLPDLEEHGDSLDFNLDDPAPAETRSPSVRPTSHAGVTSPKEDLRFTAQNLFSAKHPSPTWPPKWLLIAAISILCVTGLSAYFWWQMQAVSSGLTPVMHHTPPAQTLSAAPSPQIAAQPTTPVQPAPAQDLIAQNPAGTTSRTSAMLSSGQTTSIVTQTPPKNESGTSQTLPRATANIKDSALQLTKGQTPSHQLIDRAFDALNADRLDDAQRDYQRALRDDPRNTDVLLGLASIALRRGQPEAAQAHFVKILELDPNDASAQAGLASLRSQNEPDQTESRLKIALSNQPESGPLHFALGNLYARQQRWSEAQQAYFKAYANGSDNPDYLFNLAVSLDQLHQSKLAAQYYQMALNASAASSGFAFDREQTKRRILELQP